MNRHHYMPTEAQKQELKDAAKQIKERIAAKRAARLREEASRAQVLGMLSVVIGVKPMDNPLIGSSHGAL